MPLDQQAELDADLQTIADAKASGFMDCLDVRNGLGWDKPGPNGSYYNAAQTAYRWIEDAGEQVVYILPDGGMYYIDGERKTIPKAERTGVYPDVFARVLAYKNAYYAKLRHDEWSYNMATAVDAREKYGAQTKNMDFDVYIESLGPEPSLPDAELVAATQERQQRATNERAAIAQDDDERVLSALRTYTGPLTKRGLPTRRELNAHAGFSISGDDKRRLWSQTQAGGGQ